MTHSTSDLREIESTWTSFQLSLEYVGRQSDHLRFRLAFDSSIDRFLLYYPEVTGLRFTSRQDVSYAEWCTRYLHSAPRDEFVVNPGSRIAFDLQVHVNVESSTQRLWTIKLPPGDYQVEYEYSVDPITRRYDYLGKGSRFADMTKAWSGEIVSNTVDIRIG